MFGLASDGEPQDLAAFVVAALYKNSVTEVDLAGERVASMQMDSGIKRGGRGLSGTLFALALDPMIWRIRHPHARQLEVARLNGRCRVGPRAARPAARHCL